MNWRANRKTQKLSLCQKWLQIYPVYPFLSAPLFETHRATKMPTAYVNNEYLGQSVHRHKQIRTVTFYQNLILKVSFRTAADGILLFLKCIFLM